MFEKEAEEYVDLSGNRNYTERAFKDGAEFGYNKGLEAGRPKWHNLQEDPTDIPPMKDDTYSIEVWVKGAKGNYGTAAFSYACHREDGKYNHWIGTVPVLWIELPKFEEE